jgi:phytoene dehydrogenase-like protein
MIDNPKIAENELISLFPEDIKGIKNFFRNIMGIRKNINLVSRKRWYAFLIFALAPFTLPYLLKNLKVTLGKFLDKHVKSEKLKLILAANTAYYHDNPYELSMIWFSSAQASYFLGGGNFIQGGSQNLSNYLAKIITDNGGEIIYNTEATQILIDENTGKATGIKAESKKDGTQEIFAEKIVANCAIPILYDLLPKPQSEILQNKYKDLKYACSLLSVYLGFSKPLSEIFEEEHKMAYSTIIFDKKIRSLADFAGNVRSGYETCPIVFVDYGKIDDTMAPQGKSSGVICLTDYIENWEKLSEDEYQKKKKETAEILINRLNEVFPGIKDVIEIYEVGTPRTIKRYTGSPNGTAYGFAQIPGQTVHQRPKQKTPIDNLYISSAYSMPGGGFSGTIIGGTICSAVILKDIEKGI